MNYDFRNRTTCLFLFVATSLLSPFSLKAKVVAPSHVNALEQHQTSDVASSVAVLMPSDANSTVTLPTQDPTKPDETPPKLQFNGKTLVWNDEFNGTGKPDANKWSFENGFQRNHEDQWYQADNAYLDGKGACLIEGRKERVTNPNYQSGSSDWKQKRQYAEYTSASMQSKYIYKYGTVLVRAKIPTASGSWPAIWQVGNTWEWPLGGEIDILEIC